MRGDQGVRPELDPGETILWSGQPKQGLRFSWVDLYLIPAGLFFLSVPLLTIGAMLSEVEVRTAGAFSLFFFILFFLVGGYISFGRLFVEARQRAKTYYAVTDRRIVIVSGMLNRTVKSMDLATLSQMSVTEKKNRSGTVDFGGKSGFERMFALTPFGISGYNPMDASSFQFIDRAREVYTTVLGAKRAAQGA